MSKFRKMTAVLMSVVMFVCCFTVQAVAYEEYEYKDYTCQVNYDGNITIRKYYGNDSKVVIPATIKGKKVTGIDTNSFANNDKIKSVTIPKNVTNISSGAFYKCKNLTTVSLPSTLESIHDLAFSGCTSLYNINLPANLCEIHSYAFSNCTSLKTITIPSKVESIGDYAFEGCTSLRTVNINYGLKKIGWRAFANCTSLKSVRIPESVTNIDSYALGYVEKDWRTTKVNGFKIYSCDNSVGKKYARENEFPLVIVPSTMKNIKISKTSTSVTFSWSRDEDAKGYIIEQYVGSKWKEIKKITNNKTTKYTVTGLKSNTKYKFRLKSYAMNGKNELYSYVTTYSVTTPKK